MIAKDDGTLATVDLSYLNPDSDPLSGPLCDEIDNDQIEVALQNGMDLEDIGRKVAEEIQHQLIQKKRTTPTPGG
jgi:hypothetical protein